MPHGRCAPAPEFRGGVLAGGMRGRQTRRLDAAARLRCDAVAGCGRRRAAGVRARSGACWCNTAGRCGSSTWMGRAGAGTSPTASPSMGTAELVAFCKAEGAGVGADRGSRRVDVGEAGACGGNHRLRRQTRRPSPGMPADAESATADAEPDPAGPEKPEGVIENDAGSPGTGNCSAARRRA